MILILKEFRDNNDFRFSFQIDGRLGEAQVTLSDAELKSVVDLASLRTIVVNKLKALLPVKAPPPDISALVNPLVGQSFTI